MSDDPIHRLAKLRIIRLSAELEVALATKDGSNIAIEISNRLRDRAAESMVALATCDFTNWREVRIHQNEVKRYDEWFSELHRIVAEGKMADQEMTEADREETLEFLSTQPDGMEQAIELGLIVDTKD